MMKSAAAVLRNGIRSCTRQETKAILQTRELGSFSGKSRDGAKERCLTSIKQGLMEPASARLPYMQARTGQRRNIRREPISQAQRQAEMEEEARRVDLDPAKCLKKGDPGTMQGIIKDVMPVGYFITLPSGREGYLPATDLGITGGVVLLERLMKVGQEITVRVDCIGGGGREILSMKRPECVPVINDRFGLANLSRNRPSK